MNGVAPACLASALAAKAAKPSARVLCTVTHRVRSVLPSVRSGGGAAAERVAALRDDHLRKPVPA
ncbi:MAG TPA: hypothetical protein VN615_17410 [Gaiellales bacterium]|nr:hypothetical protein [Gaiellales bacterium]